MRTSETGMFAEDAVRVYKELTRVEQAFRCLKSVDLTVRPIHHQTERRVRAHLFVCMLAYYVEWHLRSDPKGPLLIRLTDPTRLQKRALELWRTFPVNNTPSRAKHLCNQILPT